MKYYASMMPGARMSILMGDVRRNGRFYSMLSDIVKPGELQQIVVKVQHNVQSGNQVYLNRNYVPIAHEYLMIIRKNDTYWISFQMPKQFTKDIRDCKMATWRDVVAAALRRLGGTAHVSEIS